MDQEPVRIEITGELDLHTFQPREVGDLLTDYLQECRQRGLMTVRIIHGKGTGALRIGVHAALSRMPGIESITWPAGLHSGGWGATWVRLQALSADHPEES